MKLACWILTLIASAIAGAVLIAGILATSPLNFAVVACALAVVPYVFTRAVEGLAGGKS